MVGHQQHGLNEVTADIASEIETDPAGFVLTVSLDSAQAKGRVSIPLGTPILVGDKVVGFVTHHLAGELQACKTSRIINFVCQGAALVPNMRISLVRT